jgi:nicotinamidase-related amidase
VFEDHRIGEPQGNDILKGAYCGCSPNRADWGPGKKCVFYEKVPYLPYYGIVEHGGTDITPWIDGPKGEDVGDYVVNTRFGYFEGGVSNRGLFFTFGIRSDPSQVEYMIRDGGIHLQKPTYKILQKHNITELYLSGYGDHGVYRGIKEAQILGYSNITLISDAFNGTFGFDVETRERIEKGSTHEEKRNNYFTMLQQKNVQIKNSSEIVYNAHIASGRSKPFKIVQPSCLQKKGAEPKRALLLLDLQEGFVSSCADSNKISNNTIPDSHRVIPRINAFQQWVFQKKDFFSQIHFSQTMFTKNKTMLNESEYPLAKGLLYKIKDLYKSDVNVFFSSRNRPSFFDGRVDRKANRPSSKLKKNTGTSSLLGGGKRKEYAKNNPTALTILWDQDIKQLFLAGTPFDDTIIETAREARLLGFSVFILTDLTQAYDEKLREGAPKESLMRYYYYLADEQKIFSIKSTDLSEEYHAQKGLYIPFSDWMEKNGCIKKENVEKFRDTLQGKVPIIRLYLILLIL